MYSHNFDNNNFVPFLSAFLLLCRTFDVLLSSSVFICHISCYMYSHKFCNKINEVYFSAFLLQKAGHFYTSRLFDVLLSIGVDAIYLVRCIYSHNYRKNTNIPFCSAFFLQCPPYKNKRKLFKYFSKKSKKNCAHKFIIIFLVGEHKNFLWSHEIFEYFLGPSIFTKSKLDIYFCPFLLYSSKNCIKILQNLHYFLSCFEIYYFNLLKDPIFQSYVIESFFSTVLRHQTNTI